MCATSVVAISACYGVATLLWDFVSMIIHSVHNNHEALGALLTAVTVDNPPAKHLTYANIAHL